MFDHGANKYTIDYPITPWCDLFNHIASPRVIRKNMHMEVNIKCLISACDKLSIKHEPIDQHGNLVKVLHKSGDLYFQISTPPFNTAVMANICADKEHSYNLLKNKIRIPRTKGFLDFNTDEKYQTYIEFDSLKSIALEIQKSFSYPVVVKKNKGALGVNVFLCKELVHIENALIIIFNRNSAEYDYIAIAQEYIAYASEYRLVCFRGKAMIAYERVSGDEEFNALYWDKEKGCAKKVTDSALIDELTSFVSPSFTIPGLEYVGFDIIRDKENNLHLIEINASPKFDHYIEHHGTEDIEEVYIKILTSI